MIPRVLGVNCIVIGCRFVSAYRALVLPSVHPSILNLMVGIRVFGYLCWMFLRIACVGMICCISEVWFRHPLLN